MPRTFGDIKSLYSDDMTGVYSGGLVYEYSQEDSNYGLVNIQGGTVTERPDFANLAKAYKDTPNPTGDGGYRSNAGAASKCPAKSSDWLPSNDALPAIPAGAVKFMTQGAGKGVGLKGAGSQDAGGASTGTASAGSGQPTSTGSATSNQGADGNSGSSSSSGAATPLRIPEFQIAPLICVAVVTFSSLFGAALL